MNLKSFLSFFLVFLFLMVNLYPNGLESSDEVICPNVGYEKYESEFHDFISGSREDPVIGPAGGLIFYDRGRAGIETGDIADCWRFLEVAPEDLDIRTSWSNVINRRVGTELGIGSGRTNTRRIIKQPGHEESAAKLCLEYAPPGREVILVQFSGHKDSLI